jgi:hypothetical protein
MGGTKVLKDCYISLMDSCIVSRMFKRMGMMMMAMKKMVLRRRKTPLRMTIGSCYYVLSKCLNTLLEDYEQHAIRIQRIRLQEETEGEFLARYAAAASESIEFAEKGDIDDETQYIELCKFLKSFCV